MNITELTKKVRESAITRTKAQQVELLIKANIIDKDGYYSTHFFSERTVANDKAKAHPLKV